VVKAAAGEWRRSGATSYEAEVDVVIQPRLYVGCTKSERGNATPAVLW